MRSVLGAAHPGVRSGLRRGFGGALLALAALAASCSSSAKLGVRAEEFGSVHRLFVLVAPAAHFQGVDATNPATINGLLEGDKLGNLRVHVQFASDEGPPPRWSERRDVATDPGIEVSLAEKDRLVEVAVPEKLTEGSDLVLAAVLFHDGDWKACEMFPFPDLAARGGVTLQVRRGRIETAAD
jgi:hypothetical protein